MALYITHIYIDYKQIKIHVFFYGERFANQSIQAFRFMILFYTIIESLMIGLSEFLYWYHALYIEVD